MDAKSPLKSNTNSDEFMRQSESNKTKKRSIESDIDLTNSKLARFTKEGAQQESVSNGTMSSSNVSEKSKSKPPKVDNLDTSTDPFGDEYTDRRLWIGNLDIHLTEHTVLTLLKKHGAIRKMDFVYHKAGPLKGKSRGYCFVSFDTWEEAEAARKALDGVSLSGREMLVKWAQGARELIEETTSNQTNFYSASTTQSPHIATASENLSADAKIKAIEDKLRKMQESQGSFGLGETIRAPPGYVPPVRKNDRGRGRYGNKGGGKFKRR